MAIVFNSQRVFKFKNPVFDEIVESKLYQIDVSKKENFSEQPND